MGRAAAAVVPFLLVTCQASSNASLTRVSLDAGRCHADGSQEYCPSDGLCHPDGKCGDCNGHLTEDTDSHTCIDRRILDSHAGFDIAAAIIWFLGAGLAMSAGVGGGGIFVPLGVILLRFASKPSTGLSQASIFGASLGGLLLNIRSRHPMADRPLIDLDMALFLSPMEMAGALIGVMIQKILPTWAVILAMATILGYTAVKTYSKGLKTFMKERRAKQAAAEKAKEAQTAKEKDLESSTENVETITETNVTDAKTINETNISGVATLSVEDKSPKSCDETASTRSAPSPQQAWTAEKDLSPQPSSRTTISCEEWLRQDAKTPYTSLAYLFVMWAMLIILLVVKGGKGSEGLVEYCSAGYWSMTALSFVWLFGFATCMGYRAVCKSIQKEAVNYPFVEGDVIWTWQKFRSYSALTFSAGVVAGLIGIGGGMVLGPMMLQLGILPQVSSATTATMVVMTSSAAALVYVTGGLVPLSYAITFFWVAFVGAYIGKLYIDKLVKKYQMTSIIVLILASIIAFASVMMSINGILIYSDKDWQFEGLNDVC
eukprot:TRINITY_DN80644_c0_g1_i1.p1 TRINITY_DN80644_c0_g1~~TRINITY_DN80644_c0_g1_i1.p1  ORF type:complete len:545 (+),score=90.33 TRINITY_DN80644_c0_g1_i1:33-1667(+)